MSPPQPIFPLLVCHSNLDCYSIPVNILIVLNHNMSYLANSHYLKISPPIMVLCSMSNNSNMSFICYLNLPYTSWGIEL